MLVDDQIGSQALRADAVESITCGYLSGIVVAGLIAQLLMPGWSWVDSIASSSCCSERAARRGKRRNMPTNQVPLFPGT
jgi:hypothetical protein